MTHFQTMTPFVRLCAASLAILAAPATTLADATGEQEYMNSCAVCHGIDGAGRGPMMQVLSVAPPPLTGLSQANDGVFPMARVIEIIDGRRDVRGHGTTNMPVWGAVYTQPTQAQVDPEGARLAVRGRILSLAYYLESIQE